VPETLERLQIEFPRRLADVERVAKLWSIATPAPEFNMRTDVPKAVESRSEDSSRPGLAPSVRLSSTPEVDRRRQKRTFQQAVRAEDDRLNESGGLGSSLSLTRIARKTGLEYGLCVEFLNEIKALNWAYSHPSIHTPDQFLLRHDDSDDDDGDGGSDGDHHILTPPPDTAHITEEKGAERFVLSGIGRPIPTTIFTAAQPIDVAILIALKEEWKVFWPIAGSPEGTKDEDSGRYLFRFEVPSLVGRPYRCVAVCMGDMGPGQATDATHLLLRMKPRLLVNLGIAAAIHDDLKLCDVVIADQVDDYVATVKAAQKGKSDWAFELRGSVYKATFSLVQDVDSLETARARAFAEWRAACGSAMTERADKLAKARTAETMRDAPALERVHLASGPVLAASESFSKWIRTRDGLLKALEMESAGMMLAAYQRSEVAATLVLRGISDFGDRRKSKTDRTSGGTFRYLAMFNATQLLWTLLRHGLPPRHEQSTTTPPPPGHASTTAGSRSSTAPITGVATTDPTTSIVGATTGETSARDGAVAPLKGTSVTGGRDDPQRDYESRAVESDTRDRSSPEKPHWDAKKVLTQILHNHPPFVAEGLYASLLGAAPARSETHRAVAERVAAYIDSLGHGPVAAKTLICACYDILVEIQDQHPADFRSAQRTICKVLSEWMPRRYDGAGAMVRHTPAPGGCPDLEISTATALVSAFHVAGADERHAQIDGKRLRGKWSVEAPVAVGAEMLSPEQAAEKIAADLIGEDRGYHGQYMDTVVGRRDFAAGRFRAARKGLHRRPRDLTLSADEWATLMPVDARARLKAFFPELRQVTLTTSPGPYEAELVQSLIDIFKDHEDGE
jgi:nucleoside phosphorylase